MFAPFAFTTCGTPSVREWPPQGVPMRVLQEMMGHRDFKTTLIYADYAPSEREAEWVEQAFQAPNVEPRAEEAAR